MYNHTHLLLKELSKRHLKRAPCFQGITHTHLLRQFVQQSTLIFKATCGKVNGTVTASEV